MKAFDPGALRHRITLQSAATSDHLPSPAGVPPQDAAQTWSDVGEFWANIEPQRIRRSLGVDAPTSSLWSLVTLRNPGVPITVANRLTTTDPVSGLRILVVDGVQRVGERNELLEIEVTENPPS